MDNLNIGKLIVILTIFVIGCSSQHANPTEPDDSLIINDPFISDTLPDTIPHNRHLLGSWTLDFHPEESSVALSSSRFADTHLNITTFIPAPSFQVISYDPYTGVLEVDTTLVNPYGVDAYDLRIIVYTDNAGSRLMNSDAWINLYDIPGGGTINPFKAVATDEENRIFAAYTEHTERLQLYFPAGMTQLEFAIDCSYPGNCEEPYSISNFRQTKLYAMAGMDAALYVDVADWQDDANSISIVCQAITGLIQTPFEHLEGDTWRVNFVNDSDVKAGNYSAYIKAASAGSGILFLYDLVTLKVDPAVNIPNNFTQIIPDGLNLSTDDILVKGNYAYTCGMRSRINLYNIEDPANPYFVKNIVQLNPKYASSAFSINGNYLYVAQFGLGLSIFDISEPENEFLVCDAQIPWSSFRLHVDGEYAYAAGYNHLYIADINPPEDTYLITTFDEIEKVRDVEARNGYAYVAGAMDGLYVVDVDPPDQPAIVSHLDYGYREYTRVQLLHDYAYVCYGLRNNEHGLDIYDISVPNAPVIVGEYESYDPPVDFCVDDNYAYLPVSEYGVEIVDINPPESVHEVGTWDNFDTYYSIANNNNHVYAISSSGIHALDVDHPDNPELRKTIHTNRGMNGIAKRGNIAFLTSQSRNLMIVDISEVTDPHILGAVPISLRQNDIKIKEGYAYISAGYDGLFVVDIDPVAETHVVDNFDPDTEALELGIWDDCVYVANDEDGVNIYNISNPESVSFIRNINVRALSIAIADNLLFVGSEERFFVYDIHEPSAPFEVIAVDLYTNAENMFVCDGYLYIIGGGGYGIVIYDVDPVLESHYLDYIHGGTYGFNAMLKHDSFLYAVCSGTGMFVYDVDPPEYLRFLNDELEIFWWRKLEFVEDYLYCGGFRNVWILDF